MKNIIFCFIVIIIYSCSSGSSSNNKIYEEDVVVDTVLYDKIEKCSEEDGKLVFYKYTFKGKTGILDKDKQILVGAKYENCIFEDGFYVGIMKDKVLEAFKKDGTLFFDAAKGIKGFYKEELCDGRYFYYTYSTGDYYGALSKDGTEIFPINYKGLEYFDKEEDSDAGGDLIHTFVAEDKSGSTRLLYVYIDDDNKVKRYPLPLQEGIYESKQFYHKDEDRFIGEKDTRQLRVYKDYIILDRIKIPYYGIRNGSKYYRDSEGVLYYFSDNYKSFHHDSELYHRDYQLIYKFNDGASSNSGYSEDGRNDIYNSTMQYNEPSYNSNNNNYSEPVRNPCRACRGTGDCPVCKGSCQTKTKVVYHYDGGMDLEWEQCKSCGGDGRHQGCGGDGWLDEGVDF